MALFSPTRFVIMFHNATVRDQENAHISYKSLMFTFQIQEAFVTTFFGSFPDYVFFETSSTAPYQIRRIEELNKVSITHYTL